MDFKSTIELAARRWYLVAAGLIVALVVSTLVFLLTPSRYASSAAFVLTPPNNGGTIASDPRQQNTANPLLTFTEGLNTTATILIQSASSEEAATALGAPPGGDTSYTISDGSSNPEVSTKGPFIFVDSSSSTADAAVGVVRRVEDRLRADLQARQSSAGVPPATYIAFDVVVPPTRAEVLTGDSVRPAVVAGLFALILVLAALYYSQHIEKWRLKSSESGSSTGRATGDPPPSEIEADTETMQYFTPPGRIPGSSRGGDSGATGARHRSAPDSAIPSTPSADTGGEYLVSGDQSSGRRQGQGRSGLAPRPDRR